ncbi:unnamed protein product [Cochlearia groenlandica]
MKIVIEKITKKNSLATCFAKRSNGLYSKASQLCLLSDAQIAILATPSSSQSNVSFFSYGHSSVDSLVSAYLSGNKSPPLVPHTNKHTRQYIGVCLARKDLGLGFWWDDEKLHKTENLVEIKDAMESMSSLLTELRSQHATCNPNDDCLETDRESFNKKSEDKDHVMMMISDTLRVPNNNELSEEEMDQLAQLLVPWAEAPLPYLVGSGLLVDFESSLSDVVFTNEEVDEFASMLLMSSESVDSTSAEKTEPSLFCSDNSKAAKVNNTAVSENLYVSDNNNNYGLCGGSLGECSNNNEEMDIDELIDFESTFDGVLLLPDMDEEFDKFVASLMMNSDHEAVGERFISEDDLNFSGVFDGLTSITTL